MIPLLLISMSFASNGRGPWYTDGMGPIAEEAWGTDDILWDTDNDGYGDGFEVAMGWDPLVSNGNYGGDDNDGDILSNAAEQNRYNTNPNAWDTDNDGIGDSIEIARNMDPNSADYGYGGLDTDEDKLTDAFEINVLGTDEQFSDTDHDDYTDSCEYAAGTDPTDANSHPTPPEGPPTGGAIGVPGDAEFSDFMLVMILLLQLVLIYMLWKKK